jgi:hypothetical protein
METLFLIYDESFEPEISGIIERGMVVSRYTRVDNVVGARMAEREATGFLADRRNRLIILIAETPTIAKLVDDLRGLRARKGRGLRAFVVKAETVL